MNGIEKVLLPAALHSLFILSQIALDHVLNIPAGSELL